MTSPKVLHCLFIREGLPPLVTAEQIRQHVAKQGVKVSDIIDIAVHKDFDGHCIGYGYITCSSSDAAQKAASLLNETGIADGYKLKVHCSTDSNYRQCLPSDWPEIKKEIIIRHLRSMASQERENLYSLIHLPAKISLMEDEIMFLGNQKDVLKSQEILQLIFLDNIKQQTFTYQCVSSSAYKTQIEKVVLIPLKNKLDFYYSMKFNDRATLDVSIFSENNEDFHSICNHMQELCPHSCQSTVLKECIYIVKKVTCDLETKHRARIETTAEGSITICTLTKREADLCLREIEDIINAQVITKVIPVSHSQAQYLEAKHKLQSEAEKNKVKLSLLTQQTNGCTVTLEGTNKSVIAVMEKLKCCIETEYNEISFDIKVTSKYIKMWFKRWQQLKIQQEAQNDIMIQFVQKHMEQNETYVTVQLWGSPQFIDPLKDLILTRECENCVREMKISLPKHCAPTVSKGLRNQEINIQPLAIEVEIDETSDTMMITAPIDISDEDLTKANEIVLFYIGNQKQPFTLSDPVMGLILASPKYSSQLHEITKPHNVKVDVPKFPNADLMLTGNPSALENAASALQKLQMSMIADIDQTTLLVDPQHVKIIESGDFAHLCNTLQDQLFVCCSRGYRKMNITILNPVFIQPTPLSHCIKFEVVEGSLVNENVYAIVNNTNENMQHTDGEAKLIADTGGPSIQSGSADYIKSHGKLKPGDVVCLGGGSLLCRRVIHVVWPQRRIGKRPKKRDICTTFSKVLNVAKTEKIESVSFSVFGSQISPELFAQCVLSSINDFCKLQTSNAHIHNVRCVVPHKKTIIDEFLSELHKCALSLPNPPTFTKPNKFASKESSTLSRNIHKTSQLSSEVTSNTPLTHPSPVSKIETTLLNTWEWQDDTGSFTPYEAELCKVLSTEYANNSSTKYPYTIGGNSYVIDMKTMTQTNTITKKQRCVHRIPATNLLSFSTSITTSTDSWEWLDDTGSFIPYDSELSKVLSMELARNLSTTYCYVVSGNSYIIDFKAMTQTNTMTKKQRCVRRIPATNLLSSLASTCTTTSTDFWEWQDDTGIFTPYDSELSKILSTEYAKNSSTTHSYTKGGNSYCVDFKTMTQTNTTTKKQRCVQRIHAITALSPSTCAKQVATEESSSTEDDSHEDDVIYTLLLWGLKMNLEDSKTRILEMLESTSPSKNIPHSLSLSSSFFLTFPLEWQPQSKTTELFHLYHETPEWDHITQLFQQSMPKSACTIMSVKRIQNKWLWERYFLHKKRLHVKNDGVVNEKELFHGTRTNEPKLIYESEDGFDMRYSAQGMWGRANYFAANASYSHSYAHINASTGLKEMFLVKLLTGESHSCAPDSSLCFPPPKPSKGRRNVQIELLKYDTVTGSTGGSQVFMAYDNEKAYPAYLIEYKETKLRK